MKAILPAPATKRQPGASAGVSAPVYGLTTPPGWTPTERVRLAVARGLGRVAGAMVCAGQAVAHVACIVAPGWRR